MLIHYPYPYPYHAIQRMKILARKTRHFVRDMKPEDELRNLRIRTKQNKEVIVSHDKNFIIIVIQHWIPFVPKG